MQAGIAGKIGFFETWAEKAGKQYHFPKREVGKAGGKIWGINYLENYMTGFTAIKEFWRSWNYQGVLYVDLIWNKIIEISWNCYSLSWKSGDFFPLKQPKILIFGSHEMLPTVIPSCASGSISVLTTLIYVKGMDIQNVNLGEVDFLLFHFRFLAWTFIELSLLEMKRKCTLNLLVIFTIVVMI